MLKLPNEILEEIASKARELRRSKKISQEDLAKRSGVSLGSVKRFEQTGRISLEFLLKIALVLDSLAPFEKLFAAESPLPDSLDELINQAN